jgi:hypothetical protein
VAHLAEKRNAYRILEGKSEKETTWRTGCGWEDNITLGLRGI